MPVVIKGSGDIDGSAGLNLLANGTAAATVNSSKEVDFHAGVNVGAGLSVVGVTTSQTYIPTQGSLGYKNHIINGGFQVHQRGNTTHSYSWCGDRFQHRTGTSAVIAQSGDVPVGFSSSMTLTASSGTLNLAWNTVLEVGNSLKGTGLQNVYAANTKWTVSIWSTALPNVRVDFTDGFGPTNPQAIVAYTAMTSTGETSNGFTRYSHTFDIASVTPVGTSEGLHIGWQLASAAASVKFTGAQLERGEKATPFEHLPYQDHLRRSQRYHYRVTPEATGDKFGIGFTDNDDTNTYVILYFPVTLRKECTGLGQSGTASDYDIRRDTTKECTSVPAFSSGTRDSATIKFVCSSHGWGTAAPIWGQSGNGGTAYLEFGAEFT